MSGAVINRLRINAYVHIFHVYFWFKRQEWFLSIFMQHIFSLLVTYREISTKSNYRHKITIFLILKLISEVIPKMKWTIWLNSAKQILMKAFKLFSICRRVVKIVSIETRNVFLALSVVFETYLAAQAVIFGGLMSLHV